MKDRSTQKLEQITARSLFERKRGRNPTAFFPIMSLCHLITNRRVVDSCCRGRIGANHQAGVREVVDRPGRILCYRIRVKRVGSSTSATGPGECISALGSAR